MVRPIPTAIVRDTQPDLNELIEQLVSAVVAGGHRDPEKPSVLLDVRVGACRCVVLRAAPTEFDANALSPREIEIARMVAKGYPNKVIAKVLDISTWTVGTYLRRSFAKLGVSSRAALVAKLAEQRSEGMTEAG
jgi:DNA-binding CsgD family transcriptional regulator